MTTLDTTKAKSQDYLVLKWGTLKRWSFHTDECVKLLEEYRELGSSVSAIMQHDTPRQKEIICELIDHGDFEQVYLDWDGRYVSKEEAKAYVLQYHTK